MPRNQEHIFVNTAQTWERWGRATKRTLKLTGNLILFSENMRILRIYFCHTRIASISAVWHDKKGKSNAAWQSNSNMRWHYIRTSRHLGIRSGIQRPYAKPITIMRFYVRLYNFEYIFSIQTLLCKTVSIVFHSAATVRFDEKLKQAVTINMLGTKRLVELCNRMNSLEVSIVPPKFVQNSTKSLRIKCIKNTKMV